jgi:hypothetical protein
MRPPALAEWFATGHIHGDRFAALGDVQIEPDSGPIPAQAVDTGRILYCMTDRAGELFSVIRNRKRPCILITHNADRGATAALWASKPDCVRHWFAQNAAVVHPGLTPIPIGLERPSASGGRTRPEAFQRAVLQAASTQNLTYLSHSDRTNRWERMPIRWSLSWRDWVTARGGRMPFEEYLQEMARHRSVISPPGNGLDCHRTWEALYLGVIPLVRDCPAMRSLASLFPIALFDTLATLTRRRVEEQISRVSGEGNTGWEERLQFSWWERRILRVRDELCGS